MSTVPFPTDDTPTLELCSSNVCSNGHSWPPTISVTPCPGCESPILAVKMVNCPFCNEPVNQLRLRTDHLSTNMSVIPLCKPNTTTHAEVTEIILDRQHHKITEAKVPTQGISGIANQT